MKCNNIKINTLILMKRQLSTLLSLILVIILFVLFLVYLYILPLYQLPAIILTSALSALFFYFIYYRLTYSNNNVIRFLQKCIVFSFCFYVPVLIGVIFDLYLFQVTFSDVNINNVKDFIRLWLGDELSTFLESFNNFISHLSFKQLWAVCNILSSLFILILILNIISIIYSDYLLTYFKY